MTVWDDVLKNKYVLENANTRDPDKLATLLLKNINDTNYSNYLDEQHTNKKIKLIWNPETEFYDEEVLQEKKSLGSFCCPA